MEVDTPTQLRTELRGGRLILLPLCTGLFMVATNATTVAVALPSLARDLEFAERDLVWVVNAYLTAFGGSLLLSGRLGDVFGRRRMFMIGVAFFTVASLGCGLATSAVWLVGMRFLQGLAGSLLAAVSLALIAGASSDVTSRARGLGLSSFVGASGGSAGLLLGGVLVDTLGWRWVFLVNVFVGAAVLTLCFRLLPSDQFEERERILDASGAITSTSGLMLLIYGVLNGDDLRWAEPYVLAPFGAAALLFLCFVVIEMRARLPLIPGSLLSTANVLTANIVAALWSAAAFAWSFISVLFLQHVLHLRALKVAVTFLPANLVIAVMSLFIAPSLIKRTGVRAPLVCGMAILALGLAMLASVSADPYRVREVAAGMIIVGLGTGTAYCAMLVAAMNGVRAADVGAASGLVNTSLMLGGSLGLAVVSSISMSHVDVLIASGLDVTLARANGYRLAYWLASGLATSACLAGVLLQGTARSELGKDR